MYIGPGTINVRRLEGKKKLLAGVIAAQTGKCGDVNEHSIYVSVYEHLEWIEIITGIQQRNRAHCVQYVEHCTIL